MASQTGEHDELCFTGESAEEAQDFVQAVHRRAYAAGRQKENAWIAEFACPCFSRKALLWYETLDEETQNDWKLLKRAILAEFSARQPAPATVPSAAPAVVTSLSSPTPTNPPPAGTVKIGRIRVDSEDHTGYFWINPSNCVAVLASFRKANLFELDTAARTLSFQGETLAIRAYVYDSPLNPRTYAYGRMMKSSVGTNNPWKHTWSIAEDGNITAMLTTDGDQYDANFLIHSSDLGQDIRVCPNKEAFLRHYGSIWTCATLLFEPLT